MKSNQYYFNISQENDETNLDEFYVFDEKHKDLSKYIKKTKEIKNILITIKTLKNKKEKQSILDKYYLELQKTLNKVSNCSEFISFVNACDNTLDAVKKDLNLIKKISNRYFEKRELNEFAPEEWIQAILDSKASRKKGKCGEIKLIEILNKYNYGIVKKWEDFFDSQKCVVNFSGVFNTKGVRNNLKIKLATKKQDKNLDLIIKNKNKIFLLEAKHLNTSGGGQDKQISELIEILSLKEDNINIRYVSFLDGSLSNRLLSSSKEGNKMNKQRKEIKEFLNINPQNFWVNTKGFEELIKDLK